MVPNCQLTNTTKHKFDENAETKDKVWTFRKVNADRSLLVSTRDQLSQIKKQLQYTEHSFKNASRTVEGHDN